MKSGLVLSNSDAGTGTKMGMLAGEGGSQVDWKVHFIDQCFVITRPKEGGEAVWLGAGGTHAHPATGIGSP